MRALDFPEVGRANSFKCELFRSFEADRGGVPGQPEQPAGCSCSGESVRAHLFVGVWIGLPHRGMPLVLVCVGGKTAACMPL